MPYLYPIKEGIIQVKSIELNSAAYILDESLIGHYSQVPETAMNITTKGGTFLKVTFQVLDGSRFRIHFLVQQHLI
ncbi:MAG: hypothetical protein ACTSVI_07055 [Promethearchaeota archaeon]